MFLFLGFTFKNTHKSLSLSGDCVGGGVKELGWKGLPLHEIYKQPDQPEFGHKILLVVTNFSRPTWWVR